MIGRGMRVLMERVLTATGLMTADLVEKALPIFLSYYQAHIADQTQAYPGAGKALEALRARGARLAICTNKPEGLTRKLLSAFGWEKHFAAVVGGDTTAARKPHPTPLFVAIERSGGGRAVLIGDSINDTETAKAAALPCLAVTFGYRDRPAEELGATRLIDRYDELIPILLGVVPIRRISAITEVRRMREPHKSNTLTTKNSPCRSGVTTPSPSESARKGQWRPRSSRGFQ